ncbi:MAG: cytochrome c oxidase assembly factor Coa1 family protein [Verrucomicrobiota bacterium]
MEQPSPPENEKKSSTGKVIAFIGCGCLSLIALAIIIGGAIFMGVFGLLKKTEPYQDSLAVAQSNPAAIAVMGEPIEPGFFVSGSVNFSNGEGSAELTIPVSGPNATGSIEVIAKKATGATTWSYEKRELKVLGEQYPILLGP